MHNIGPGPLEQLFETLGCCRDVEALLHLESHQPLGIAHPNQGRFLDSLNLRSMLLGYLPAAHYGDSDHVAISLMEIEFVKRLGAKAPEIICLRLSRINGLLGLLGLLELLVLRGFGG